MKSKFVFLLAIISSLINVVQAQDTVRRIPNIGRLDSHADKDSKLYVNNRLLIRWEGSSSNRTYTYMVPLKKGFYPLRLEYLCKNEDFKLKLSYLTPAIMNSKDPISIPLNLQYSHK